MNLYRELLREFWQYSPSAWALVFANLLPLFGVLFLGWSAFEIVGLYWVENVVIGAINVLKMIACNPRMDFSKPLIGNTARRPSARRANSTTSGNSDPTMAAAHHASKLFLVPFFILHYGVFCLVHGIFIGVLLGSGGFLSRSGGGWKVVDNVSNDGYLILAVTGLAASHLYSFFHNFLWQGEYRRTDVARQMFQPYARVVVLHVAILLGAFAALALGSNIGVLAILTIGKTILDLGLHLRERERNSGAVKPTAPEMILHENPRL